MKRPVGAVRTVGHVECSCGKRITVAPRGDVPVTDLPVLVCRRHRTPAGAICWDSEHRAIVSPSRVDFYPSYERLGDALSWLEAHMAPVDDSGQP